MYVVVSSPELGQNHNMKIANRSIENLSSPVLSKSVKIRIHKIAILPMYLYGCENRSLTLREEHTLRVFDNRVLRRIFGPKRDEVTGDWRKLHNEEHHNLYSSPNIIRMIKSRSLRWEGNIAEYGRREMHIGVWRKSRKKGTTAGSRI
jgi:hypothetical protein